MPKSKNKTLKKSKKNSKEKQAFLGAAIALILVGLFVIYLGFNSIKKNNITTFEQCAEKTGVVMESYPRQCMVNGKTYIEEIDKDENNLEILQIKKGTNDLSLQFARGNYIINTEDEWNMLFGNTNIWPEVDFNKKTVLAVVMGQKPSGGYSVSLKQLEVGEDEMNFLVQETVPGENCTVTEALTNPYQIIAIDKTDSEIKFLGETIVSNCE